MKVSDAFADIVRRRAYRGLGFDKSLMRVVGKYELGAYSKQKLVDTAIDEFGYENKAIADAAIHSILKQSEFDHGERLNDIHLNSVDPGSILILEFSDGTCITLIYDKATDFIVLTDTSGVLVREDVLQVLGLKMICGHELKGIVRRYGAAYPDSDHCYVSECISGIKLMQSESFIEAENNEDYQVVEGRNTILSHEPDSDGVFRISSFCEEDEYPLFELELDTMQYRIAPGFNARNFDMERLSEAIAASCEVVDGNNPLLLHTVTPGRLKLCLYDSVYLLEAETKIKVSMSPRHEDC